MHSFNVLIPLAFAAAANAVQFTNAQYNVVANQPFTITWSGNTGPVTIFLKNGNPGNLQTVNTVVSGAQGNSFTWIPAGALPNDVYALQIEDDGQSDANFSPQFQFQGGVPALPTTSGATASMTISTSASAPSTTSGTTSGTTPTSVASASTNSSAISSAESSATETASNATTVTGSRSSTRASATSTVGASTASKASATASKASASATASETGTNSGANQLAKPVALILVTIGALAFFN